MTNPDSAVSPSPSGPPLILASGSPRRRELLGQLGIPFRVAVSDVVETIAPGLGLAAQAISLAEQKAGAVASGIETGIVLGADTLVELDGTLLGKPMDHADAIEMLWRLSGRDHRVVTGIAVVDAATGRLRSSAVSSAVRFRRLSAGEIVAYVASGEPRDKAGAYAIQGRGADLVGGLEGCFTNVVGLPLCETASLLVEAGVTLSATWVGCLLPGGELCPAWFDRGSEIATKSSLGVARRACQQEIPGRPMSALGGVSETLGRLAHYGNDHEEKA